MVRATLACALWLQGLTEKALYESEASLRELRGTDHQLSVCPVLYYGLCRIAPMTGDFATADRGIALNARRMRAGRQAGAHAGLWKRGHRAQPDPASLPGWGRRGGGLSVCHDRVASA
jgi:hypothetical protein